MRILLVDDDPDDLFLLEEGLRRQGVQAEFVALHDGDEALARIEEWARQGRLPDLVLMDAKMPRMGGVELFRRLREEPATARIPGVLVSSSLAGAEEEAARAVGLPILRKPMVDSEYQPFVERLSRLVPGLTSGGV